MNDFSDFSYEHLDEYLCITSLKDIYHYTVLLFCLLWDKGQVILLSHVAKCLISLVIRSCQSRYNNSQEENIMAAYLGSEHFPQTSDKQRQEQCREGISPGPHKLIQKARNNLPQNICPIEDKSKKKDRQGFFSDETWWNQFYYLWLRPSAPCLSLSLVRTDVLLLSLQVTACLLMAHADLIS